MSLAPAPLLALALALPQGGGARELVLETRRELPLDVQPEFLTSLDVDGDGRPDLVATVRAPGALLVWRAAAGGLAAPPERVPVGDWPLAPVLRGASSGPHLLVASRVDGTLRTLDPGADWAVVETTELGAVDGLPATPRVLLPGPFEGSRSAQIALATDLGLTWRVAGGALAPLPVELPRCGVALRATGAAAFGYQSDGSVRLAFPDGAREGAVWRLPGFARALCTARLEGPTPVLVAAGGDRSVWLLDEAEDGAPRVRTVETAAIPIAVRAADLDGDGRDELAVLHLYDVSVSILGDWRDGAPRRVTNAYTGQNGTDLELFDADGDGHLDVCVANQAAKALSVLRSDGAGGLRAPLSVPLGPGPGRMAVALQRDDPSLQGATGGARVAVLDFKENSLTIVAGPGRERAEWGELQRVPLGGTPRTVTTGDVDGDGLLDVGVTFDGAGGLEARFLPGNVHGALDEDDERSGPVGLDGLVDVRLVDLDGDRRDSLIVAVEAGANAAHVLDVSNFRDATIELGRTPAALCIGNFDGDGAPEAAVACFDESGRSTVIVLDLYTSEDSDLFEPGVLHRIQAGPGRCVDVASGDLDGDGRDDLALLQRGGAGDAEGWVVPLLARGDGFVEAPIVGASLRAQRIALGDLDGDGLAEVLVVSQNAHVVDLWQPTVAPEFALVRRPGLGVGRGPLDLGLLDIDGDGDLDVVVVNGFSKDLSVVANRTVE